MNFKVMMLNNGKIFNHQLKKPSIIVYYVNKPSNFIEKFSAMMDFSDHTL